MDKPPLWHWTCHHGREGIGLDGEAIPLRLRDEALAATIEPIAWWMPDLVWFTDDPHALRHELGLTSGTISCDRMAFRYEVTDSSSCVRWLDALRMGVVDIPRESRSVLHRAPLRPGTWWVSGLPVPVVLVG